MKDTTCKGPAGATGQGGLLGGGGIGPETWWLSVVGGIASAKALGQGHAWRHEGQFKVIWHIVCELIAQYYHILISVDNLGRAIKFYF